MATINESGTDPALHLYYTLLHFTTPLLHQHEIHLRNSTQPSSKTWQRLLSDVRSTKMEVFPKNFQQLQDLKIRQHSFLTISEKKSKYDGTKWYENKLKELNGIKNEITLPRCALRIPCPWVGPSLLQLKVGRDHRAQKYQYE